MAHYDLEEQEQLAEIKAWWNTYGNLVTGVITAAAIAVAGWQGWNWYRGNQAAQASVVFSALEEAVQAKDAPRVKAIAGELTDKFGGTSYAALGALLAGKNSVDSGDLKTARLQLAWAAENGKNETKDIARLRLASVLIEDKAYDEALKQLEGPHAAAFDARFSEMKAEALLAQGKKADAKTAFQAALTAIDSREKTAGGNVDAASSAYRDSLQQRLDALGEAA